MSPSSLQYVLWYWGSPNEEIEQEIISNTCSLCWDRGQPSRYECLWIYILVQRKASLHDITSSPDIVRDLCQLSEFKSKDELMTGLSCVAFIPRISPVLICVIYMGNLSSPPISPVAQVLFMMDGLHKGRWLGSSENDRSCSNRIQIWLYNLSYILFCLLDWLSWIQSVSPIAEAQPHKPNQIKQKDCVYTCMPVFIWHCM